MDETTPLATPPEIEFAAVPADEQDGLDCVARYARPLPVSEARVWENVLDWEHLPWLHKESFLDITPAEVGRDGWRAEIGLPPAERRREIEVELVIERDAGRYVTRTLSGPGAGSEIWTRVMPRDGTTDVAVSFHLPGIPEAQQRAVGTGLVALYTRLWDQDEAMMVRRRDLLARRPARAAAPQALALGPLDALRARLPLEVELGGRSWRMLELEGRLLVHATVCPHLLGPLGDVPVEKGCVRCPWHGYVFELASGACVTDARFRLPVPPEVSIDARGEVSLVLRGGAARDASR